MFVLVSKCVVVAGLSNKAKASLSGPVLVSSPQRVLVRYGECYGLYSSPGESLTRQGECYRVLWLRTEVDSEIPALLS
ncbi:hypothetical protein QL285_021422 [Trifolium repens]|nr:hypothetical protein QL285_021422 [Trifolium repens]